jgi:acetolactate synthase-1/2/3 large subunit
MPLYDSLLDYKDQLTHYRFAHEQGAVHAADGYARTTGKPGICFVTSGPGATNTVTGIATAFMDSVPLVVFTGQVPTALLGKDSFQEIDIPSICEPITKKTFQIESIDELAETIHLALDVATSGRKGPVLIDLPKDIQLAKTSLVYNCSGPEPVSKPINTDLLEQLTLLINASERPVIYAGGGILQADASEALRVLAEKASIPVANTLMGLGSFPIDHPLSLGLSGMHGHAHVNEAIMSCDLLLVIGARFSDRAIGKSSEFAGDAFIAQVDIDDTEFSKNINCDLYLQGDLKAHLNALVSSVITKEHDTWLQWIDTKKRPAPPDEIYCPDNIYKTISRFYGDTAVVSTDTGQHQMWTAQFWNFTKPKTFLTSGGLGTMGYGLGASIGAAIGRPDLKSVLITGDGSFRMDCQELLTVSDYEIPVTIFLMNNNALGMVRQWQKLFHHARYSETNTRSRLNYIKLCEAYEIPALKIHSLKELEEALVTRQKTPGPFLIEVVIDENVNVYPIVPPGKSISDYLLEGEI